MSLGAEEGVGWIGGVAGRDRGRGGEWIGVVGVAWGVGAVGRDRVWGGALGV
ncbi:hypothetical protein GCM10009745_27690 [Kribbella yunnanensis]|uniref:AraC family transcriptional regulator n=1 Tax=Kribbella yunnanensis TaxID=190194 RepID=A0ABP4T4D5_9ACTN